jgi:hypothetical protein
MPATQRNSAMGPEYGPASGFLIREDNLSGRVLTDPLLLEPPWNKTAEFARARLQRISEHTAHPLVLTHKDRIIATAIGGIVAEWRIMPAISDPASERARVRIHQFSLKDELKAEYVVERAWHGEDVIEESVLETQYDTDGRVLYRDRQLEPKRARIFLDLVDANALLARGEL